MKTITFDESIYRLTLKHPDSAMKSAGARINNQGHDFAHHTWETMLNHLPDTLPGVVEHSGEPDAWLATDLDGRGDVGFNKEIAKSRAGEGCTEFFALFDHPPAQPDAELKARIAELEAQIEACQYATEGRKHKERIAELEAQAWQDIPTESLGMAFMTISAYGNGANGRELSLKFNRRDDAHAVHDFLIGISAGSPAPANSLAIVQTALEAAAKSTTEYEFTFVGREMAKTIRAIPPQSILDSMEWK